MNIKNHMSNQVIKKEIGQRIKRMRINAGITQEAMAEKTGLSIHAIGNIESGKGVSFDALLMVLRVLHMLENVNSFVPEIPLDPEDIVKLGKKRERVRAKR